MITCPICGLAERTRDQRDIVFWCGYFVGLNGELRVVARCSNALATVAKLRAELAAMTAERDKLRAEVERVMAWLSEYVLSPEPYTQADIERGKQLVKDYGWDA